MASVRLDPNEQNDSDDIIYMPSEAVDYRDPYSQATGYYDTPEATYESEQFVQPSPMPNSGPMAGSGAPQYTSPVQQNTTLQNLGIGYDEVSDYVPGETGLELGPQTASGAGGPTLNTIERQEAIIQRRIAEANALIGVGGSMETQAQAAYQLEVDETNQTRQQLNQLSNDFDQDYTDLYNAYDRQQQIQENLDASLDRLRVMQEYGAFGGIYASLAGGPSQAQLQHDVARQRALLRRATRDATQAEIELQQTSMQEETLRNDLEREQREDDEKYYELQMIQNEVSNNQIEKVQLEDDLQAVQDAKDQVLQQLSTVENTSKSIFNQLNTLYSTGPTPQATPIAGPRPVNSLTGWLSNAVGYVPIVGTPASSFLSSTASTLDNTLNVLGTIGDSVIPGGDPFNSITGLGYGQMSASETANALAGFTQGIFTGSINSVLNNSLTNLAVDVGAFGGSQTASSAVFGGLDTAFSNFRNRLRGNPNASFSANLSLLPANERQAISLGLQLFMLHRQRNNIRGTGNDDFDFDPGDGGDSCFIAGTKIAMADGTEKNIEDVIVGDTVKSFDTDTNRVIDSSVANVFVHLDTKGYYIINNNLKVTSNHPMWVDREWKQVKDIVIGDKLTNLDGIEVDIETIEQVDDIITTYNFEVENVHNYYANMFLAHNKAPPPPPPPPDFDWGYYDLYGGNSAQGYV